MYEELYETWKKEKNPDIQVLPPNFYIRLADYLKETKEKNRMLDRRTTRANLMQREFINVKRLVKDLTQLRYEKILSKILGREVPPRDFLAREEEKLCSAFLSSARSYEAFIKEILRGHSISFERKEEPRMVLVRFLKRIPAIIGSDMKTYGPFEEQDLAILPLQNARLLVKQGVAVEVEAEL